MMMIMVTIIITIRIMFVRVPYIPKKNSEQLMKKKYMTVS